MKFSEIYGQEDVKTSLVSAAGKGRIPHAQMFIGNEGSNALPIAIAYAQYVSCENKSEHDSCGICPSCVKYAQLIHPDLHLSFPIFGAENDCNDFMNDFRETLLAQPFLTLKEWFLAIGAENKKPNINIRECRNILRKLSLKTYESEYKVLIMWLPEYLGKEGNVLLKLIEEPPAKTLFLLVTENRDAILTTIISRTQYTRIPPYTEHAVRDYLLENNLTSEETARNIAALSEGNLSLAVEMSSQLENPQFSDFRKWLQECYQGNISNILRDIETFSDRGKEGLKLFIQYGMHMMRSVIRVRNGSGIQNLVQDELEFVTRLSRFIHQGNAEKIYNAFNHAIYELERNGSVKLVIINLSLSLKNCLKIPDQTKTVQQS